MIFFITTSDNESTINENRKMDTMVPLDMPHKKSNKLTINSKVKNMV